MFKKCTGCGVEKPFEEYGKDKKGKFGINQKCKICCRIRNKNKKRSKASIEKNEKYKAEWQKKNRNLLNVRLKERYKNNLEKSRLQSKERVKKFRATEKGKTLKKKFDEEYASKYKERVKANNKTRTAIYANKLIRPNICDKCKRVGKVHAHHEDYTKPLDVIWMCPTCHLYYHQRHRFHADRLSERTPEGDAKVRPNDESVRGRSEEVSPPVE